MNDDDNFKIPNKNSQKVYESDNNNDRIDKSNNSKKSDISDISKEVSENEGFADIFSIIKNRKKKENTE